MARPLSRSRVKTFMSSTKAGNAEIDMKVRNATTKNSSALRLYTLRQSLFMRK